MWQGIMDNRTLPSGIDNKASSAFNNGNNCTVHWFLGANYSGSWRMDQARGTGSTQLNATFDNDISSMNWC